MKEYTTTELIVAAFLVSRGWNVSRVESEGPIGEFVFPDGAREDAAEFFQDGLVSARKFANAIRELKARVRFAIR